MIDSENAVIGALYDRLVDDADMRQIMGVNPPRIHLLWAPENAAFPYVTHSLDIEVVRDVIVPATWRADVWDFSPNATRTYGIRRRIIELMDGLLLPVTVDTEVQHIRMKFAAGGMIGTDAANVWRYGLAFACTYTRAGEIRRIRNG